MISTRPGSSGDSGSVSTWALCNGRRKEKARLAAPSAVLTFWLAGNEGMENNMETTIMGHIGATTRIYCFFPS